MAAKLTGMPSRLAPVRSKPARLPASQFTPGKSAVFNFTDTFQGRIVRVGSIAFTLGKGSQIKISARRKGTPSVGGIQTLRAQQFKGQQQAISEMIPVKLQVGNNVTAAFYVPATGAASVKTANIPGTTSTQKLSTVKLKGAGSGTPSQ